MVPLDHEGENQPWYALFGTLSLELKCQRTMKRAEMWAFSDTQKGVAATPTDNLEMAHALREGSRTCIAPRHKDADWWNLVWVFLLGVREQSWCVEVTHIRAHTTNEP